MASASYGMTDTMRKHCSWKNKKLLQTKWLQEFLYFK